MAKKKKTIRSIPQQRTPVREQDPKARVKNFEEVNCGYSLENKPSIVGALSAVSGPGLCRGLPGQYQYPQIHRGDQRKGFPRRL